MQVAQDLLVKKLGELTHDASKVDDQEEDPNFDFSAQHFQCPVEEPKMTAIQVLIEEGHKKKKAGANSKKRAAQVVLEADSWASGISRLHYHVTRSMQRRLGIRPIVS